MDIKNIKNLTAIEKRYLDRAKKEAWKTRSGKKVIVSEMQTDHIKNALEMLKNRGFIGEGTVSFYIACIPPTADGALMAFEHEYDMVMKAEDEGRVTPFIDMFEAILKERGAKC